MICLFLLQSFSGYSQVTQEQLQGEWIVVNITMADGSMVVNSGMKSHDYMMYSFISDTLAIEYLPGWTNRNKLNFKFRVKDDLINCPKILYQVLFISSDSIELIELNDKIDLSKNYRYSLLNRKKVLEIEQQKQKGSDTFIANKNAMPLIRTNPFDENYERKHHAILYQSNISGTLYLNLSDKSITVKIEESNKSEKANNDFIKFIKSANYCWDLNGFPGFKYVSIPFSFKDSTFSDNIFKYKLRSLVFFNSLNENIVDVFSEDTRNNQARSTTLFNKGIKLYKKDKLSEALPYFEESYELNPENTDALYNMGSIHFKLGDVNAACTCYLKLKNMGQKEAADIYDQYCKEQ